MCDSTGGMGLLLELVGEGSAAAVLGRRVRGRSSVRAAVTVGSMRRGTAPPGDAANCSTSRCRQHLVGSEAKESTDGKFDKLSNLTIRR